MTLILVASELQCVSCRIVGKVRQLATSASSWSSSSSHSAFALPDPGGTVFPQLGGVILLEQNDEWAVQRARYMTLETISQISDDPPLSLPAEVR